MILKKIDLYDYFKIKKTSDKQEGILTCYIRDSFEGNTERQLPGMLVLPGGGYFFTSAREAEPVALAYLKNNFHSFVLNYSCSPVTYPAQILEAAMAMIFIRENREELRVSDKVAAIGFSAGGHLCGCLATLFNSTCIRETFSQERAKLVRPDAVILSYSVLCYPKEAHVGSFENLTDKNDSLSRELSLENAVTPESSPAFIWHTFNDNCVPVSNSLRYATACNTNGVPFSLHIYENGGHGISLANDEVYIDVPEHSKDIDGWLNLSVNWLRERGFVKIH